MNKESRRILSHVRQFIGLCRSKLSWLAKWISCKDIKRDKVASEHIRIYNLSYKYISVFILYCSCACTHILHMLGLSEKEANNIDENQHLQKAAIPWFHLSQSLNISFIMLACFHHPHPVTGIFLHFLLLLSSKKVEPLYHLLSTT